MNFSISQAIAIKCLNHVIGSTDKKDFLDILSSVKVDIFDGTAKFTTTNLDMQSSDSTPVQTNDNFSFLAPIHSIMEVVKNLPSTAEINFSIESSNSLVLKLKSGKFTFDVSTLPVQDFPVMPNTNFEYNIKIQPLKLLECIKKTQFSISNDEARYNLNGLMIQIENEKMNFVSTDGHRLSIATIDFTSSTDLPNSIIPKRAVSEISKIITGLTEDVTINVSSNKISVHAGSVVFTSKLIDGSFPDYKRVIPSSNDKILSVECGILAKAVELVSVANMGQDNKGMIFSISEKGIAISSKIDSCQASEFVSATYTSTEEAVMKYNYRYVLDVLSNIGKKDCLFKISSPDAPVLITPSDDENLKFIIMPMKM